MLGRRRPVRIRRPLICMLTIGLLGMYVWLFATSLPPTSQAVFGLLAGLFTAGALLFAYFVAHAAHAESEAANERARVHSAILQSLPDGVLIVGPDGIITECNEALEHLVGYTHHELVGQHVNLLVSEHLRTKHAHLRNVYMRHPTARPMGIGMMLEVRCKDGLQLPVEISLSPLYNPFRPDEPDVIAVIRDVRDRRAAEREHRRLEQARTEAEAAVKARDEFLSIAAHELKSPMTTLIGYTQLLEAEAQAPEPSQRTLRRAASQVGNAASRLNRLVSQLLDVSRMGAGKVVLYPRPVDLKVLVREACLRACARHPTRELRHSLSHSADCKASVDAQRIEQVLDNLLDNAVKFAPDGPIEVTLDELDGQAQISVRDHGPGVPRGLQERVFERAFQANPASSDAGLGLGLYISRQLIVMHGGSINVESPEGGGARFVVRLPVAQRVQ